MDAGTVTKIYLTKVAESPFCVSNEDGLRVHTEISNAFHSGEHVELSFAGVTRLTTAFLNAAIGQLYDEFTESEVVDRLRYVETDESHLLKIRNTVANAKSFFLKQKSAGQ